MSVVRSFPCHAVSHEEAVTCLGKTLHSVPLEQELIMAFGPTREQAPALLIAARDRHEVSFSAQPSSLRFTRAIRGLKLVQLRRKTVRYPFGNPDALRWPPRDLRVTDRRIIEIRPPFLLNGISIQTALINFAALFGLGEFWNSLAVPARMIPVHERGVRTAVPVKSTRLAKALVTSPGFVRFRITRRAPTPTTVRYGQLALEYMYKPLAVQWRDRASLLSCPVLNDWAANKPVYEVRLSVSDALVNSFDVETPHVLWEPDDVPSEVETALAGTAAAGLPFLFTEEELLPLLTTWFLPHRA